MFAILFLYQIDGGLNLDTVSSLEHFLDVPNKEFHACKVAQLQPVSALLAPLALSGSAKMVRCPLS